jgi:hypothetical protein
VVHACHLSYLGKDHSPSEIHPRQNVRPYLKNNLKQKRAGGHV